VIPDNQPSTRYFRPVYIEDFQSATYTVIGWTVTLNSVTVHFRDGHSMPSVYVSLADIQRDRRIREIPAPNDFTTV